MLPPDPRISVVIPHLDDIAGLRACIACLDRQTLPRDRFEIVVADNGSSVTLREIEAAAPGARIVRITERGAGPARNGGVAASTFPVLAFTDSDCLPEPQWLELEGASVPAGEHVAGGWRCSGDEIGDRMLGARVGHPLMLAEAAGRRKGRSRGGARRLEWRGQPL